MCAYVYMLAVNDCFRNGVVAFIGFGDGGTMVCRRGMAGGV